MKPTLACASFVLFISFTAFAQDAPQRATETSRSGTLFSMDAGWSQQNNLDFALRMKDLPTTPVFQAGFGAGWIYRIRRTELSLEAGLFGRASERRNARLERMTGLLLFNTKYLIGGGNTQWYPMAGIGMASGTNRISPNDATTNLSAALSAGGRNTTSLYNREGIANFGLGFRSTSNGRSFFGLEAGYRLGFSTRVWSTRVSADGMTNSLADELRQFYVRLVAGSYRKKRS